MNVGIASFLPKYKPLDPEIAKIIDVYPNTPLNKTICSKEEFRELASDQPQKSKIFNHQQIIARLMSSHTPYDAMLLAHEMGSGKTCSVISAIEAVKAENALNQSGIKKALILAKGDGLLESFKKELISKNCTDGQYIPENYEKLNADTKIKRVNKLLNKFYNFSTFETFAKSLKGKSNELIKRLYSNHFIVMDEIHNVRIQDKKKSKAGVQLYQEFHRFLHAVEGCKILLLSGTPMKDNIGELGAVMNLILPLDMQIQGNDGVVFDSIPEDKRNEIIMRMAKSGELASYLQGRISYMQTPVDDANVVKQFIGTQLKLDIPQFVSETIQDERKTVIRDNKMKSSIKGTEPFRVLELKMSKYQTNAYMDIYKSDSAKNYYINARLASLFTWTKGPIFNTQKRAVTKMVKGTAKTTQKTIYTLNKELVKDITTDGVLDLDKLKRYSIVYASAIRILERARDNGQLSFVYCEFKHKSGLFLFQKLLEMIKYSIAGGDALGSKGKRLVLFEGSMNSANRKLLDMCNDPINKNGEYISMIMGTRVVMEGYSFKNIQNELIFTPHWNYSETSQAIARGFRARSHKDLNPTSRKKIDVNIFQIVSIPDLGTIKESKRNSINMRLYQTSFSKDINIKYVERIIKENAIDCQLLYSVNSQGQNGSRECEYMKCEYECEGGGACSPVDYSTYNLYYNESLVTDISKSVQTILNNSKLFTIHFRTLKRELKQSFTDSRTDLTDFTLLSALNQLIQKRVPFIDRYGFKAYLAEFNNEYYLTTFISSHDKTDIYYTRYPTLVTNHNTDYIIASGGKNNIKMIFETIDVDKQPQLLKDTVFRLAPIIQERILENLISWSQKYPDKVSKMATFILDLFKGLYFISDTSAVSWLLEQDGMLRCKDLDSDNRWAKCSDTQLANLNRSRQDEIKDFTDRAVRYGYYGTLNPLTKDFCLVDVSKAGAGKGNVKSVGMRCSSHTKLEAVYTKITGKVAKTTNRVDLCRRIRDALTKLNLVRSDTTCGSNKKLRIKTVKVAAPAGKGKGKGRGRGKGKVVSS